MDVASHHGDICLHDGKIYCAAAVHENGNRDSWVYVYRAEGLQFLERIPLEGITAGVDGIEWKDGRFYLGDDKGCIAYVKENKINVYDEDFKSIGTKIVPGWVSGRASPSGRLKWTKISISSPNTSLRRSKGCTHFRRAQTVHRV